MNRRKAFLLAGISALGGAFTGLAAAADITYDVDQTVGAATVTGTITTNGFTGSVGNFQAGGSAFFQSYDLTLTGGGQTATIVGPTNQGGPFGGNIGFSLSATPTELIWNFGGGNSALNFAQQIAPAASACWQLLGSGGTPSSTASQCMATSVIPRPTNGMAVGIGSSLFTSALSGPVVFAKVGPPPPPPPPPSVPEPGSLGLLAAGLVGLLGLRKRLV